MDNNYLLTPEEVANTLRKPINRVGEQFENVAKAQANKIADRMLEHVKAEPDLPPRWVADIIVDIKREVMGQ